jgi:recombinational DNA repair protein (RecF pathway)
MPLYSEELGFLPDDSACQIAHALDNPTTHVKRGRFVPPPCSLPIAFREQVLVDLGHALVSVDAELPIPP